MEKTTDDYLLDKKEAQWIFKHPMDLFEAQKKEN